VDDRYQTDYLSLANISCEVLTLMPAIAAYLAMFPPSSDDGGKMAKTKT